MAAANGFAFILTGDEFAAPIRDPAHGSYSPLRCRL